MRESYDVTVEVEKSPGHWITVARWRNDAATVSTAQWAAALLGGRTVIEHRKAWTVQ